VREADLASVHRYHAILAADLANPFIFNEPAARPQQRNRQRRQKEEGSHQHAHR